MGLTTTLELGGVTMLYDSDKGNPLQWLPQPDKEDADCTILELWARYADDIANFAIFGVRQLRSVTIRLHSL